MVKNVKFEPCAYSAKFKVTNGVRQGGILSPYLFNVYVYVDELSEELVMLGVIKWTLN